LVYLVEEIESKRQYVLKFFTPSPTEMKSFSEEAQANMRL